MALGRPPVAISAHVASPTSWRPPGVLAWDALHVRPEDGDPFFIDIQDIYDEIGEGLPPGTASPRPGELPDRRDEVEASGLFDVVAVRHYDWEVANHDAGSTPKSAAVSANARTAAFVGTGEPSCTGCGRRADEAWKEGSSPQASKAE